MMPLLVRNVQHGTGQAAGREGDGRVTMGKRVGYTYGGREREAEKQRADKEETDRAEPALESGSTPYGYSGEEDKILSEETGSERGVNCGEKKREEKDGKEKTERIENEWTCHEQRFAYRSEDLGGENMPKEMACFRP